MNTDFENRVAIVSGAGKGLGRAYAIGLAEQGVRIVVNNRKHANENGYSSADETVAAIVAAGGTAIANYESAEEAESGQRIVEQAMDAYGRVDIVIPNAGVARYGEVFDIDESVYRESMEINFFGTLRLLKAALPTMRDQQYGRIVFCVSTAGLFPTSTVSAYGASKAAVVSLLKSVAMEEAEKNILVNGIAPYAATDMLATLPLLTPEQNLLIPSEAVVPMVLWFASSACNKSGEIILNGGRGFKSLQGARQSITKFVSPAGAMPSTDDIYQSIDKIFALTEPEVGADVLTSLMAFIADLERAENDG